MREQIARLHAQTRIFQSRVTQSIRSIEHALNEMTGCSVSFSTGKDSSCVLHLVRSMAPDTMAVYADDEWILPESDALIQATPNLIRVARPLQHTDWFTSWTKTEKGLPADAIWTDGSRWQYIRDTYHHDGVFLGLRADENARRRIYIRTYGTVHYSKTHQMWHCNPIAHWTVRDVWAYLYSRDVPYNAAYDVLERLGIPWEQQRVGPFATERAVGYGQLALLKQGWPEMFNRFAAQHPEARLYV